jgi:hypothetical protein
MKTKEEIIREKIYGAMFLDIVRSIEEAMEEYAQQFKEEPKQLELPKRWEDLEYIKGYYVSLTSDVSFWDKEEGEELEDADKILFATKEQAEAAVALAQISQLREVYRQGWEPDWNAIEQEKFILIYTHRGIFECSVAVNIPNFLSFQSPEIRDEFLENFRDLIEKAKPLMS